MDDTFVILSKYTTRSFLVHINNINEAIQLTVDSESENGELVKNKTFSRRSLNFQPFW